MHFTPRPRWLMIVSTATVVLPVLRSPMMSSRCPRPMGVMASMALMPVCSGSCTGWRPMMPGAWISRRRSCTPTSGPLSSTGLPRASTTRPSTPSPTGTERMRPVALTVWPSLTSAASPRTTQPIDSSSRLRARPTAPLPNSSSSLTAAPGRPDTLAMPSPTSVTRPTWAVSTSGWKPSRFLRRAAAMSAVLMVSSDIGSVLVLVPWGGRLEGLAEALELGADRAVDHRVAHLGDHAAEDRRVDHHLEGDLAAGGLTQRLGQAVLLVLVQRHGGANLGHGLVGLGRAHLHQLADDGGQLAGAARAHHHRHQGDGGRRRLAAQQVLHDLLAPRRGDGRVGERIPQLVGPLEGLREAEQLLLDVAEGAFRPGHVEQGIGIGERAVVCHRRLPQARCAATWLM